MIAVIETGGKQYRVSEGDIITIEKLNVQAGDKITFDKVLILKDEDNVEIGTPYIEKNVFGTVIENGKGKKVIIYKYKSKKDYRKKQGHRQPYTMVEITGIGEDKVTTNKVVTEPQVSETVAVADTNEKVETKAVNMSMKKDEIIAFAKENNIEIDEKATKQVLVDTINQVK